MTCRFQRRGARSPLSRKSYSRLVRSCRPLALVRGRAEARLLFFAPVASRVTRDDRTLRAPPLPKYKSPAADVDARVDAVERGALLVRELAATGEPWAVVERAEHADLEAG